ncbi:DNA-binding protein [Pseudomonas fluorescens]|uniref:DNA-binding protein n=1 Tax=Pseudomonas fluorescens TaxID=294 RepID=UPI0018C224D0|nr:DNA-binding protein [Pseudomonas fluorescens]
MSDDIFAAADAILASSRNATPTRARAYLGHGTPQRIGALLDQRWARRAQKETRPALLKNALAILWEQATIHARAIDGERQSWAGERLVMEKAFTRRYQALEQALTKE